MSDYSYEIKDLYIGKFNNEYIKEVDENNAIHYFNQDLSFIIEKLVIERSDKRPYIAEYYAECITEEVLMEREADDPFLEIPKIFASLEPLPEEYLNEEEKKTGKISMMRLFQVFQDINVKTKVLTR